MTSVAKEDLMVEIEDEEATVEEKIDLREEHTVDLAIWENTV